MKRWPNWLSDAQLAAFEQPVALPVVRDWLSRRLTLASPSGFLSGGVTFCAMVPMRSIPFRLLCLIGMNDGAYPRDERPVSFDLVARHPRRGDRSRRFDDRYLFLEAILSARQTLYLSYVGQSARSNEPLPPSPLLSELLDTFAAMSGGDVSARLVVRHPLQPFAPACYDGRAPQLASFEPTFAAALAQPPASPAPFAVPLPTRAASGVVNLHDFIRFWKNPVRAWLAERLAIRLIGSDDELPVREPFALEREARQDVRRQLLEAMLHRQPLAPVQQRLVGAGLLPLTALGLARRRDGGQRPICRASASAALRDDTLPPQPVTLTLAGLTLTGELTGLRPQGWLSVVPRMMNASERIELWLTHLILCATRPAGVDCSSVLCHEGGNLTLTDEPAAAELLTPWLVRWQQGQDQPLPFFGRTSWAYAEALAAAPDLPQQALQQAQSKWDPAFLPDGSMAQKDERLRWRFAIRRRWTTRCLPCWPKPCCCRWPSV
ncbi:exodeoxyribonuclease V subunit gamma [Paludibacterium denitrificans]|uniref:exodeoxyribonuclease V subunit gamma n=1 Tax=Paludibacterium denitrificans TaxID=2675226 RepID=UPI001E6088C9|nr:exodeoxyribonuclease V subunit gamma [Paludibacterium denitrificans]